MAVLIRLSDQDRETYKIAQEWLRFDEADLDDVDGVMLAEYEAGLGVASFGVLFEYDKPRDTIRWQIAQVWLACRLAGIAVPQMWDFKIKIRKAEWKEEATQGGDADPPDSSPPSTAASPSKKRSH